MQQTSPILTMSPQLPINNQFPEHSPVNQTAIRVIKTLSYLLLGVGGISFVAGLHIPAIGLVVAGFEGLICGFACARTAQNGRSNFSPDEMRTIRRFVYDFKESVGFEGWEFEVNNITYVCRKIVSGMVIERANDLNSQPILSLSEGRPEAITVKDGAPIYQCLTALSFALIKNLPETLDFLEHCNTDQQFVTLDYYRNSETVVWNFLLALEKFSTTGELDVFVDRRASGQEANNPQQNIVRGIFQRAITPANSNPVRGLQDTLQLIDDRGGYAPEFDRKIAAAIKQVLPIIELIVNKN